MNEAERQRIADAMANAYYANQEDWFAALDAGLVALGLGPLVRALDACDSECVHDPDCLVNEASSILRTPPGGTE